MCGRYTLRKVKSISQRFEIDNYMGDDLEDRYNLAPGEFNPVIIEVNNKRKLDLFKWGLVPSWVKDIKRSPHLINSRKESLDAKPFYKGLLRHKRCLIPASGFYEWDKTKQPYYFEIKGNELFGFAGLYDEWMDAEGNELWSYSVITTEPNEIVENVHGRMPFILSKKSEADWLNPDNQDNDYLLSLLEPINGKKMEYHMVSKEVNSPKNDYKKLIDTIN